MNTRDRDEAAFRESVVGIVLSVIILFGASLLLQELKPAPANYCASFGSGYEVCE